MVRLLDQQMKIQNLLKKFKKKVCIDKVPILNSSNAQIFINFLKVSKNNNALNNRDVGFDLWPEY